MSAAVTRGQRDHNNRLAFNDDMFLRIERVLQTPMVNQIVWRFDRPLQRAALQELCDRIATGPLNRLVSSSRVPIARDSWIPAPPSDVQLAIGPTVAPEDFRAWIDEAAASTVDPLLGPSWLLTGAPLSDGGSVLAFIASHVTCDASLLLPAIDAAVRGEPLPCLPDDRQPYPRLRSDLADATGQLLAAGAGVQDAWRRRRSANGTPQASGPAASQPKAAKAKGRDGSEQRSVLAPTAFVELEAGAWDAAAAQRSGTPNSLLIAVTASLYAAAGYAAEGTSVAVAVPVATRTEDDRRANTTVGVQVPVLLSAERYRDLSAVRAASRDAFKRRAAGAATSPIEPLKPLMQMLPDLIVEKLAANNNAITCTCSNIGAVPQAVRTLGGQPARTMVLRTVTQRLTPERARRLGGGLTAWLAVTGSLVSLCVQSLDLDRFPDNATLQQLVGAELSRWGLAGRIW